MCWQTNKNKYIRCQITDKCLNVNIAPFQGFGSYKVNTSYYCTGQYQTSTHISCETFFFISFTAFQYEFGIWHPYGTYNEQNCSAISTICSSPGIIDNCTACTSLYPECNFCSSPGVKKKNFQFEIQSNWFANFTKDCDSMLASNPWKRMWISCCQRHPWVTVIWIEFNVPMLSWNWKSKCRMSEI